MLCDQGTLAFILEDQRSKTRKCHLKLFITFRAILGKTNTGCHVPSFIGGFNKSMNNMQQSPDSASLFLICLFRCICVQRTHEPESPPLNLSVMASCPSRSPVERTLGAELCILALKVLTRCASLHSYRENNGRRPACGRETATATDRRSGEI